MTNRKTAPFSAILMLAGLGLASFYPRAYGADRAGPIKAKADGLHVEMFSAIKSGEIEVTFIPKNSSEANVLFKNNTDRPLAIRLPEAFAGVPVFAQFGGAGGIGGAGARRY